jgi:hypothetical protein
VSGRRLSAAQVEQRRAAATTHGARSPNQIKARARAHRRRFLRQIRLRASDLDAFALGYLDGWARALAKVDAYDAAELDRDPREYHAALNAARLWLAKLEARLTKLGLDRGPTGSPLDEYLERTYGGGVT